MVKPLYIIVGESGCQDGTTGKCSVFNLIERLQFSRTPAKNLSPQFTAFISAVWDREDADEEVQYDTQFAITMPQSHKKHVVLEQQFTAIKGKAAMRFNLLLQAPAPIDGEGILEFSHSLKQVGTNEWLTQSYPIRVEELKVEQQAESKSGSLR